MLDFTLSGNKLTRLQKHFLQLMAKSKSINANDANDIVNLVLDDKIMETNPEAPFHFAMYLDENFKLAGQRKMDQKMRNLDEMAKPEALTKYSRDYPETFFSSDWVVTTGEKKGTIITKPSDQLLGDAIYGAALCLYAKSLTEPFTVRPKEGDDLFHEITYEFHVNGSLTHGYFKTYIIPIYVKPNGFIYTGYPVTSVSMIEDKERYLDLSKEDREEQSEDLEIDEPDIDYDDLER